MGNEKGNCTEIILNGGSGTEDQVFYRAALDAALNVSRNPNSPVYKTVLDTAMRQARVLPEESRRVVEEKHRAISTVLAISNMARIGEEYKRYSGIYGFFRKILGL